MSEWIEVKTAIPEALKIIFTKSSLVAHRMMASQKDVLVRCNSAENHCGTKGDRVVTAMISDVEFRISSRFLSLTEEQARKIGILHD